METLLLISIIIAPFLGAILIGHTALYFIERNKESKLFNYYNKK
jgi:hypothetical protein